MEIERKYLISSVPFALSSYPCRKIEQGYLSTAPVVRIRRDNNDYILTYKSKGMMIREEYNLPLTKESYEHLKEKIDGRLITKKRYVIPLKDSLFIELDIFSGDLAPLMLAEVEFPDEETANHYTQQTLISTFCGFLFFRYVLSHRYLFIGKIVIIY